MGGLERTKQADNMEGRKHQQADKRCLIVIAVFACLVCCGIGIVIGRYAVCPDAKDEVPEGLYIPGVSEKLIQDEDQTVIRDVIGGVSSENIRTNLKMLTEKPHLAGTPENEELARKIQKHWQDVGLDEVTLTPYNVLLSYPDPNDLNYVELLDNHNTSQYKSDLREPVLTDEENKTHVVPPFNAYSGTGDVYGNMVYVNYGRVEDYLYLEANTSINVSGKIVLARYGKIFRGDKVHLAEMRGATGVILFSDPEDVTNGNTSQVYPHDWFLPPSGTQRGTVYIGDGDPMTAGYPAIETAYRKESPDNYLPSIPCHPIGYGIAIELMKRLGGHEVPENWRGGMNVTYKFGDSYIQQGWQAHIHVSTKNQNATIYNTIGIIRGSVEPDRYVLIGNHRDAWVFGAQDPSSGTAVMMEISRVLGELVKSGRWRPRRTIVFCSWGAEEYGLIGSTEWLEHYTKTLGARAIAYLNVDIAVEGNFTFWAHGTPLTMDAILAASKKVSNPNNDEIKAGRNTVYDTWLKVKPSKQGVNRPNIELPGSGSDHAIFRDRLGIPVVDIGYTSDPNGVVSAYPMYHSAYETFYLVDKIVDRGFKCHRAVGQVWVEMARHLADSLIIPFNVSDYSATLEDVTETFLASFKSQMENKSLDTSFLTTAVHNFTTQVQEFERQMKHANLKDPYVVRRINDQLMQLNRAFVDPAGLPGRKLKRHILFAESIVNSYAGSSFPGLSDALVEIRQGHDVNKQWEVVKQHFSVVLFTIQSATSTLKDVTDFMYSY